MTRTVFTVGVAAALAALGLSFEARAGLILDTTVTSSFDPASSGTTTGGNDLPYAPSELLYGQLYASAPGLVEFLYVGNEAFYTNSLHLNDALLVSGVSSFSTAGLPDDFSVPDTTIGTITVGAGELLDFGFCTSGGLDVAAFGKCVFNDDSASLIAQYNFQETPSSGPGYRSVAFRALSGYSPSSGLGSPSVTYAPLSTLDSVTWAIFWDDSGAKNDDNHDDFVAIARYRTTTSVPEPASLFLLGTGMLGFAALRRRLKK